MCNVSGGRDGLTDLFFCASRAKAVALQRIVNGAAYPAAVKLLRPARGSSNVDKAVAEQSLPVKMPPQRPTSSSRPPRDWYSLINQPVEVMQTFHPRSRGKQIETRGAPVIRPQGLSTIGAKIAMVGSGSDKGHQMMPARMLPSNVDELAQNFCCNAAPTVRPSRIAKRRPSSITIGWIR